MPTEPLLLIAALVAVLIFGRLVLNLITRFLPLIVVAVVLDPLSYNAIGFGQG